MKTGADLLALTVQRVLQGHAITEVARGANVAPSTVSKLLERCLGGDSSNGPALSNGLIPHKRSKPYKRLRPLPSQSQNSGHAGAFKQLLEECPGLKQYLNDFLSKALKKTRAQPNLKPRVFYEAFMGYLQTNQWPSYKYPYTTADLAEESCRRFFKESLSQLNQSNQARHSRPSLIHNTVFRDIEIDEHTVDSSSSFYLEYDIEAESVTYPLRLSRFTLILARDVASSAIFSPYIVLDGHINQEEFRQAIQHFLKPTNELPSLATPGLRYIEGAGFPTTIGYEQDAIPMIQYVHLDNAMVHLANLSSHFIRKELGATLHASRPGLPLARQMVESAFGVLEVDIHTLPNTVGTDVLDIRRETGNKLKHPPVVSLQALIDTIRFLVANYNGTPQARLHAASPLDVMRYQLDHKPIIALPQERASLILRQTRPVKLPVKHQEGSGPMCYVNYHYQKMKGPGLRNPALKGSYVTAMVNDRDLRKFEIFTPEGKNLGWVQSPAAWQQLPYSRSMLSQLNRLARDGRKLKKVSLFNYLEYLLENRKVPKVALSLSKWLSYHVNEPEKGQNLNFLDETFPAEDINQSTDSDVSEHFPEWSPKMRNTRSWLDDID